MKEYTCPMCLTKQTTEGRRVLLITGYQYDCYACDTLYSPDTGDTHVGLTPHGMPKYALSAHKPSR